MPPRAPDDGEDHDADPGPDEDAPDLKERLGCALSTLQLGCSTAFLYLLMFLAIFLVAAVSLLLFR